MRGWHAIWIHYGLRLMPLLRPVGLILTAAWLTSCAHADRPVATACPLPPLLPSRMRELPPEATQDPEPLLLDLASGQ